jgi:FMN phosphatase YigB (HAD superfamily)/L-amino acid N-acyltransferase YncA
MTPRRAFIVDFDGTLIDTDRIKADWKNHFGTKFLKVYPKARSPNKYPIIKKLARLLGTDVNFFMQAPFKKYLFEGVARSISKLKKIGKVLIFSLGDELYQQRKMRSSGIEKIVGKSNVIITQNKKRQIYTLVEDLCNKGFKNISMVDDLSENLETATKAYPKIVGVWVRLGNNKNKYPIIKNSITRETESFKDASDYLLRLVGIIHPSQSGQKLSILKGIKEDQITSLIKITKRDRKIRKNTHDKERFKSIKTFKAWSRRKKIIYTLVNSKGRLLGLAWFSKKKMYNCNFTFAIRIYPPARGKGIGLKFMKMVFEDFKKGHKKLKVWLRTKKGNLSALKLYQKFGFRKISQVEDEIIMTLFNSHALR